MKNMDKIVTYLKDTYQPDAIIAYGSFADGSENKNSDFDALVIADNVRMHDSSENQLVRKNAVPNNARGS